jgi:DNA mismatch repair protein MutS2
LREEIRLTKSKAIEEAKEIINKANSIIEKSIKEIKQRQADKSSIVESKQEIRLLSTEIHAMELGLNEIVPNAPILGDSATISKGTTVRLKSNSQIGDVLQPPDASGFLQIAFDSLKMRIHVNDIIPINKPKAPTRSFAPILLEGNPKHEIDVRGLYGDEALQEVDKFIDSAIVTGLHQVDIIHGKGSGALRKRITSFLQSDSRIKSHRFGEWNEGGIGVTIVDLKNE